jgi:hypothetical protein
MVQIYNEITIYIYKAIFPSGARFAPGPPAGGIAPPNPAEGVTPLCTPPRGRVYILLGCKSSWGINTAENKRPLNQEDNQAPQPTI